MTRELTQEELAAIAAKPFDEMVDELVKPGLKIIQNLSPGKANAMHMAVGASGEAGELLDCIKRWVIYGDALNRENAVEEFGDLEFFLQGLRKELGISREETLEHNKLKLLGKRFRKGVYSDEQAIARADKEPGQ